LAWIMPKLANFGDRWRRFSFRTGFQTPDAAMRVPAKVVELFNVLKRSLSRDRQQEARQTICRHRL